MRNCVCAWISFSCTASSREARSALMRSDVFAASSDSRINLRSRTQSADYLCIYYDGFVAAADTLVTPMNDSFLDFDLLAKFDSESLDIKSPSLYAEFVWECRKRRLMARRAKYTPLKRCCTEDDVAESMMSLIVSNHFVTGEIIIVDGGFSSTT